MMKFSLLLSCFFLPLILVQAEDPASPAKPTPEAFAAAADQLLTKLEEFAKVLDTVKNKPTAEAAKIKLVKINKDIEAHGRAAIIMGTPSPEIQAKLDQDKKMEARANAFLNKYMGAAQRIAKDDEILAILQPAMKEFQRVSQQARPAESSKPNQ